MSSKATEYRTVHPSSTAPLAGVALVVAAAALFATALLAFFVLDLIEEQRSLTKENGRQTEQIARNQETLADQVAKLEDAVRRLQRLENPTDADFRRLLRRLLAALRGPGDAAREARKAVRGVLVPLLREGGGASGPGPSPGNPPPG